MRKRQPHLTLMERPRDPCALSYDLWGGWQMRCGSVQPCAGWDEPRGQPDRKVAAVMSPGLALHGQPAARLEQQAETIGQRQRRFAIPAQIDAMQFIA